MLSPRSRPASSAAAGAGGEYQGLLQLGQPLPNRGTCQHYHHSYRWLRFPCCEPCAARACRGLPACWPDGLAAHTVCGTPLTGAAELLTVPRPLCHTYRRQALPM